MSAQARDDVDVARRWAVALLGDVAALEEEQRSPVVVLDAATARQRRLMLHATYARRVLRSLDADVARLHAAAAGCRHQHTHLTAAGILTPEDEAYRVGAELGDIAAVIVTATGLDPDAGRQARDAVMDEADL